MTEGNGNGIKESISTLKKQVDNLFERIHYIEMYGCPSKTYYEKQVENMKEELTEIKQTLKSINKTIWGAMGALGVILLILRMWLNI